METKQNKHQEYKEERNGIIFLTIICSALILVVAVYLIVLSIINNNGTFATCGIALGGALMFMYLMISGFMVIIDRVKNSIKNEVQTQMDINGVLHNRINYLERELNRCEEYICELQLGLSNKSINVREAINKAKPEFEAAVVKACNDYRDKLIKNIMDTRGNGWYE